MYDPYHYYRTQKINNKKYLIAGGYDHKTGNEENTEKCFLELEAHIRKLFDVKNIAYKWSSQYFEPADGLAYIGHLPGHSEHIYAATGFGGNGMIYSHIAAITLTQLILNQQTDYTRLFSPGRIKPVAGFTGVAEQMGETAKDMIATLFSGEKLQELASIAPGEGRLVKYENHKMGLYKNDNGKLFAVNTRCKHMYCEVKWNTAERSWDCPCHGARYNYEGEVITGPANEKLEIINLGSN